MPTRDDYYVQGFDHFAAGRMAEAAENYRLAIDADPKFTDAYEALAQAYFQLERFDDAIDVAKTWATLNPNDPMPHTSLSVFYQRRGMIPEAEAEAALSRTLGWKQELRAGKKSGARSEEPRP